jgi:hypothetical protein
MTKTHAQFLEELKRYVIREIRTFSIDDSDWCAGHVSAYDNIRLKIEQFEAEQKQVSDEQK